LKGDKEMKSFLRSGLVCFLASIAAVSFAAEPSSRPSASSPAIAGVTAPTLAQLRQAIFSVPTDQRPGIGRDLEPRPQPLTDCESLNLPCPYWICTCSNSCAPCGIATVTCIHPPNSWQCICNPPC
jgi:hypothetical protein